MVRCWREHGLSIALALIGFSGLGAAWWLNPDLTLSQLLFDVSIGVLTVLLFVLLTKNLRERGSPQSK